MSKLGAADTFWFMTYTDIHSYEEEAARPASLKHQIETAHWKNTNNNTGSTSLLYNIIPKLSLYDIKKKKRSVVLSQTTICCLWDTAS